MDPFEVLLPWVPQDDLLLKNAVEAGASLESLAKGAVRFSRRYSFTELRHRWCSLLYDDDVSAAAAAAMANLELPKSGGGAGTVGECGGGKKRKAQSIRKHYYAMRKRLRRQRHGVLSSDVNNAVAGCEGEDKLVIDGNLDLDSDVVNNSLVGYGNCLGLERVRVGVGEGQLTNSVSDEPLWKTIEDVSLPVYVSVEGKNGGFEERLDLERKCGYDGVLGDDALNVSDCLLNLANEDELLFMDVDGKEVMTVDKNKSCYDNVDSLLLSSPCDVQGDGDCRESQKLDGETKHTVPSRCASDGLEVVAKMFGGNSGDQHFVSCSENDVGSSGAVQSPHPEQSEGFMICVLNTQDPDIPCNDSTDEYTVVPDLGALKSQPFVKEVGSSEPSTNNQSNELDRCLKKEAVLSQSFAASQAVRQGLVPNVNSSYRPVVLGLKSENPGRSSISAVSRQISNAKVNINPSHSRLIRATLMPASDGHLKQEEIDAPASPNAKAEEHKDLSKTEVKSISLDQEGGDIEDNNNDDNNDDNDDEFPNFSDVETMILEMDLSPVNQDTYECREVLRYQHEKSKRTIMRLEQGVWSSMRRAISSQGAFAVVYGRILKKYIRKSKVILGRATNDVHVDIDLGKEGEEAHKISRRQALIKMEADGSFFIKNLGKRSIYLNGKEIAAEQVRGLSASSVIEIRSIALIFEVNDSCVRRYLENMNEKK